MRERRFKIAGLLVLVVAVEFGLGALRGSSDLWDSGLFTAVIGFLLVSVLLAVHRHGIRRAFWLGFALFGWVYLGLSVVPWTTSSLVTTKALDYLDSIVQERRLKPHSYLMLIDARNPNSQIAVTGNPSAPVGDAPTWVAGAFFRGSNGTTENFMRIGHSLIALIAGWLGGRFSCGLYRRSIDREVSTAVRAE
jgi:hypothetical protein